MERVLITSRECKTQCYIGSGRLEKVLGIDFHQYAGEVPQFTFCMHGLPDIDAIGDIAFKFHPETICEAMRVLSHELENRESEIRKAFVASVASALNEELDMQCMDELAEKITDRISGCEEDK